MLLTGYVSHLLQYVAGRASVPILATLQGVPCSLIFFIRSSFSGLHVFGSHAECDGIIHFSADILTRFFFLVLLVRLKKEP